MKKIQFILIFLYLIINTKSFDFNFENLKNLGINTLKNISNNINLEKLKNLTNSINMTKFKDFSYQNLNVLKDYFSKNNTETNKISELFLSIIMSASENKFTQMYQLFKYVNYFYPFIKENIYQILKVIPHFNEFINEYQYFGLSKEQKEKIINLYKNKGKLKAKKKCIKTYEENEILKIYSDLICEIFVSHTKETMKNMQSDL